MKTEVMGYAFDSPAFVSRLRRPRGLGVRSTYRRSPGSCIRLIDKAMGSTIQQRPDPTYV